MTVTYAVMPTNGRDCTVDCLESVAGQVAKTFVIWTDPDKDVPQDVHWLAKVIMTPTAEKNISVWWNTGIALAATLAAYTGTTEWNTLIVNDDVIAPSHLTETLDVAMRGGRAPEDQHDLLGLMSAERDRLFPGVRPSLVYPNAFDGRWVLNTQPGPVDLQTRITGWCFMLRGEDWIFADPRLAWWYGDDSLDWTARQRGGAMCVPGCAVTHLYPGKLTNESAELTAQTHRDRETFHHIWNGVPH